MRALASLVALALTSGACAAQPSKPDILFIAIDDLNDWVGHLGGNPDVRTPHLDRLAKRGVSFANAHCAAPACNPSRAALMSGMRPSKEGVYTNNHDFEIALKDTLTLTEHFRNNGYRILAGGKIYHHTKQGQRFWDDYWERKEQGGAEVARPKGGFNGLNREHFDWACLDTVAEEDMPDYRLVTWANEQLANPPADKPLFLCVGIVKPHLPWYAPKKYFDMYPKDKITLPKVPDDDLNDIPPIGIKMANPGGDHKAVIDSGQWRDAVQAYLATITFVDDQVGRLIDAVDRAPRGKETVIILWSDHGWHLGEKHHWRKFTLWEEATRAPFIIAAPGISKAGVPCARPVDFLGIYPTLCDIVGLPIPGHLQGPSLRPLLEDPAAAWDRMALTTHGRGEHGVRSDRWRYIRYHDGTEELYDHQNDPMEWKNVAGDPAHNEVKAKLATWIPEEEVPEAPNFEGEGKKREGKGGRKGKGKRVEE